MVDGVTELCHQHFDVEALNGIMSQPRADWVSRRIPPASGSATSAEHNMDIQSQALLTLLSLLTSAVA